MIDKKAPSPASLRLQPQQPANIQIPPNEVPTKPPPTIRLNTTPDRLHNDPNTQGEWTYAGDNGRQNQNDPPVERACDQWKNVNPPPPHPPGRPVTPDVQACQNEYRNFVTELKAEPAWTNRHQMQDTPSQDDPAMPQHSHDQPGIQESHNEYRNLVTEMKAEPAWVNRHQNPSELATAQPPPTTTPSQQQRPRYSPLSIPLDLQKPENIRWTCIECRGPHWNHMLLQCDNCGEIRRTDHQGYAMDTTDGLTLPPITCGPPPTPTPPVTASHNQNDPNDSAHIQPSPLDGCD